MNGLRRRLIPILPLAAFLLAACRQPSPSPAATARTMRTMTPPSTTFPGEQWMQLAAPADAGWSPEALAAAQDYAQSIGSAAVLLVHEGHVVAAWGDVQRRFMAHSIRKSLLHALMGIAVDEGHIDLDATLAELYIDDRQPLSASEKQATVRHLLQARSGIYHPAAYETELWSSRRPDRGSHAPGDFWYYNNWDFNALLTIYEQQTGAAIFDAFQTRIAAPLQMQDYRPRDGAYLLEANSMHPAYPFRISARDLARFGLLYLHEGRWHDEQLLSASWIRQSTQPYSTTDRGDDYGYLWWVASGDLAQYDAFIARGGDTQMLAVLPALDLVFVHFADTYEGRQVGEEQVHRLLQMLIAAHTGEATAEPALQPLPHSAPVIPAMALPLSTLQRYARAYTYPSGHTINVQLQDGVLVMDIGLAKFDLIPLSASRFLVRDSRETVTFQPLDDGTMRLIYDAAATNPLAAEAGPATST